MTSLVDKTVELGRTFLEWWGGELLSMVPHNIRKHLSGNRARLYIRLEDGQAHLFKVDEEDITAQASATLDTTELVSAVSNVLGTSSAQPSRTVLRLQEDTVLRHQLTMPRMNRNDLHAALSLQLDRLSPVASHDTIFDFQVTDRINALDQLDVEVVLCPRHLIEPRIRILRDVGLTITDIEIEDSAGIPLPGIRLRYQPDEYACAFSTLDWLLASTAVAALLGTLYLPLYKRGETLDSLSQNLKIVRAQALSAANIRDEITRIATDADFLMTRRAHSLAIVAGLDELSKVVPDDTWLNELRIQNDTVVVRGLSRAASAVVPAISDSSHFTTPTFTAPVTPQDRTRLEQFSLSFRLNGEDKR